MKHLYLLVICGNEWQEKITLSAFLYEPSRNEIQAVIKEYWSKYEKGSFPEFEDFIKALEFAEKNNEAPFRKGIWLEKVCYFEKSLWQRLRENCSMMK